MRGWTVLGWNVYSCSYLEHLQRVPCRRNDAVEAQCLVFTVATVVVVSIMELSFTWEDVMEKLF